MKKFKLWGTTRVHVVKVVEAESAKAALDAFDGAMEVVEENGRESVKACSEAGLVGLEIDDEWIPCDESDVIEVTS